MAQQVVARQPAISFSISIHFPFNRAGGRTFNVDKIMNTPSVVGFQSAADEFCGMARRNEPLTKADLWRFRELLIRLLFHIPAVESHQHGADFDGLRIGDEEFGRSVTRFGGLPFNFYRVVFNPHDFEPDDEPVTGMLADDLADIYRNRIDVQRGKRTK